MKKWNCDEVLDSEYKNDVVQFKWPMKGQYRLNYQWQASVHFN